jgi:hypothetical protein
VGVEVAAQLREDVRRLLVGDEVEVHLRVSLRRDDRVVGADVAGADRGDVGGRAEAQAPAELGLRQPRPVPRASAGAEAGAGRDDLLRGRDSLVVPVDHVVVEALDRDVPSCVGEARERAHEQRRCRP